MAMKKYSFHNFFPLIFLSSIVTRSPYFDHPEHPGKRNFFGIRFISYESLDLTETPAAGQRARMIYRDTCQSFF